MKPADVRRYVQFVGAETPKFGIEPLITLTSLSERCFSSTVPILYDRNAVEQCDAAAACYRHLRDQGRSLGYFPYRLGVDSMEWLRGIAPEHWQFVSRVKTALDPSGILAPGRYSPLP
jgi:hypothetical protein